MASTIAKHYARIAGAWPKDVLRPTVQFQEALKTRAAAASAAPAAQELKDVNALYSLLENRYANKYPVSPALLKPRSNPSYYDDLMVELSRAPDRSWFERFTTRWKGFLRLK
ncbi:cytochrome b pre-mrna-processing protein 6 p07253 [Diplodia corticola]|uniref:Cytochrome b pre-mrna-processing protein 6 p07253 n=1 Tax=Diplodia corticola TaxID=236234 RepID=A0A1J9R611_9PEZI|nr:cytochrome b pre-mrna-processing protein 6 p07253 [Diplodia corticola]OJD35642.1 cytochrome b pre-mrna-processing protein 6 p07253 [Diplodia corticola]